MKKLKSNLVIALIFVNSVFAQTEKYKVLEYTNEKYRFGISMEIPRLGNLSVEDFLKNKFKKEKEGLEKHQKSRDKSYYLGQSAYFTYTVTYLIDSIFNYNNTLSLVYKVNEENAIPGLEDFYYEIFNFKLLDSQAIFFEKRYFYKENNAKIQQIIEQQLPQCKIFDQANLNSTFIQIQKNQFLVLIWKGLLEMDYRRCIDSKFWVKIENKFDNLDGIVFSTKRIKDKVFLHAIPNKSTKMYLLKDDEVEIIDERDEWLKIRYYGKKTIEGWIKKSNIEAN